MTTYRRILALLLALVTLCLMTVTAYAHDVPDMDRKCSLTITMIHKNKAVPGGTLSIYRVGDIHEDDGNYSFVLSADFEKSGQSLEDLERKSLPSKLKSYANKKDIDPVKRKTIDKKGVVSFTDLPVGLYLVVQTKAAPGYAAVDPFLVSLPYMKDGVYLYDLDAEPKTDLEQDPPPTTTKPSKVPQTGQLWWPVPILACAGLAMVALGFAMNRRKKFDDR